MRQTDPLDYCGKPLWDVLTAIRSGRFGPKEDMNPLLDCITNRNDFYLVAHDFYDYARAQLKIDQMYQNHKEWAKSAFLNSIRSAKFSSDRTIKEYAKEIWNIEPVVIPQQTSKQEIFKKK